MIRFYILRHGQTDMNEERRIQGRIDTSLNATGRDQAREMAKTLEDDGVKFDKIYCSPLRRALETCELVSGRPSSEYTIDERLIEIDFGGLEGRQYAELAEYEKNFFVNPGKYVPTGSGETFQEVVARSRHFFEEIRRERQGNDAQENVLIVSHGTAIHSMLVYFRNKEIKDFWDEDVHNCDVIIVELSDGQFKVSDKRYRLKAHLDFKYVRD